MPLYSSALLPQGRGNGFKGALDNNSEGESDQTEITLVHNLVKYSLGAFTRCLRKLETGV
jgi:hypothetical protein